MDTVGEWEKAIKEYVQVQLQGRYRAWPDPPQGTRRPVCGCARTARRIKSSPAKLGGFHKQGKPRNTGTRPAARVRPVRRRGRLPPANGQIGNSPSSAARLIELLPAGVVSVPLFVAFFPAVSLSYPRHQNPPYLTRSTVCVRAARPARVLYTIKPPPLRGRPQELGLDKACSRHPFHSWWGVRPAPQRGTHACGPF